METITISKEEFENAMPVGASANEDVFDSIQPAITEQTALVELNILGAEGMEQLEKQTDQLLLKVLKKYICIKAFLSVMRQLDLVLTPSGFGIVSTDKVSPASKQRVDALEGMLRTAERKQFGLLVWMLMGTDWGKTSQGEQCVPYIYGEYDFFKLSGNSAASYQDWAAFLPSVARADEIVRKQIGSDQMDAIMEDFRTRGFSCASVQFIRRFKTFAEFLHNNGTTAACRDQLRNLMRYVEEHIDRYPIYHDSTEYQANHHEDFQNRKESSAYIFG